MTDEIKPPKMRRIGQDLRRFGPKASDHPSIGLECPLCRWRFEEGDFTTLLAVEPADEEERAKMEAGRAYTARAEEVHWTCAASLPDEAPEE